MTAVQAMKMKEESIDRAPTNKPPFTLSQIKKAIPPHCFKRSLIRSFSYLFCDIIVASFLLYLALQGIPCLQLKLQLVAWPLYWVCQSCIFTGLWMLGHDCGHHAFSNYHLIDNTVGFIVHSTLLTPYFSMKISHRHHHNNIASMEQEEINVPRIKSNLEWYRKMVGKILYNPVGRFIYLLVILPLAFPMYILFNFGGRSYPRMASHFNPYSPHFSKEDRAKIFASVVGVGVVLYVSYWLAINNGGLWWMLRLYYMPLMGLNACNAWITSLNHTDLSLPHYDSTEWDFLRGALSTMDRNFGILNMVFHNITSAHVVHHLFSSIPHYHTVEATKAIRPVLGNYYRFDRTSALKALWHVLEQCVYVEYDYKENKGVFWYRKL